MVLESLFNKIRGIEQEESQLDKKERRSENKRIKAESIQRLGNSRRLS